MSGGAKELKEESRQFAVEHLAECAAELIEWHDTARLRDGKVRELGKMCAEWVGEHDALRVAERMVEREALIACAAIGRLSQRVKELEDDLRIERAYANKRDAELGDLRSAVLGARVDARR